MRLTAQKFQGEYWLPTYTRSDDYFKDGQNDDLPLLIEVHGFQIEFGARNHRHRAGRLPLRTRRLRRQASRRLLHTERFRRLDLDDVLCR